MIYTLTIWLVPKSETLLVFTASARFFVVDLRVVVSRIALSLVFSPTLSHQPYPMY